MGENASVSSVEAFEAFAPYLDAYAATRRRYLEAVDAIVATRIPRGARSLLDVGAGDGRRAVEIAARAGIERVVLVEPCAPLAALCRERAAAAVWQTRAEELACDERFDAISCLWNVLGHVSTPEARVEALSRMRHALAPKGRIWLDLHNRYNARYYGWAPTISRILYDAARPSPANGDVTFTLRANGVAVAATGHVFAPAEAARLFRAAGLAVARRWIVDYETGERRRTVVAGHLLYELTSRTSGHEHRRR
jgi:SAM-dependent methyltransferase